MPEGTNQLLVEAAKSSDPLFSGLAFIIVVVILLAIVSKPLIGMINDYKQTNVISARADAESKLYEQLRDQISQNSKDIAILKQERDSESRRAQTLEDEIERLENEIEKLKRFETRVKELQTEVQAKDAIISERNAEIRTLTRQIIDLKDRVHSLELRIARDEKIGVYFSGSPVGEET